VILLSYIPFY